MDPSLSQQLVWGSLRPLSSHSVSWACAHLSQLPGCTRCVTGLVRTCLSSPSAHSASRGLCALVSAPCACLLRLGVYVHLFRLAACTLCPGVYFFFFPLCREGRLRCPSLHASPLSAPQSRPLHRLCLSAWAHPLCCLLARFVRPITLGYLGLPSVLQGLCALARCVCCTTLGFWSLPSVCGHSP